MFTECRPTIEIVRNEGLEEKEQMVSRLKARVKFLEAEQEGIKVYLV
jgi:hypothetical protein